MNVHYAKFQKSLIVEQFQGNYLKGLFTWKEGAPANRATRCLAAAQEITHAAHSLSRLGELHVKAGYVLTLPK